MVFDLMARRFWSTRVDLPMPGSPPISTNEPGTRPPPSTLLSSADGIVMRGASFASIWLTGLGFSAVAPRRLVVNVLDGPAVTRSSTMVFHSPHTGHLPAHLGESAPHDEQYHTLFVLGAIEWGT